MSRYFLCNKKDISNFNARGFSVETAAGNVELFVLKQEQSISGYLNNCPHVNVPLNWQPDEFMSLEATHIQCATHGALFSLDDGLCVSGPCRGQSLSSIPIEVDEQGDIYFSSK